MGRETALLLVVLRPRPCALLALALLASCQNEVPGRVDAGNYDAFFLWAGVRPPPALARAKVVYILAGEVRGDDGGRLIPLRAEPPHLAHADVWLTVRAERIDWSKSVYQQLGEELARWDRANVRFAGLQVDFDARTRGLAGYAQFLRQLRRRLPARYRLSITGLMDWSAHGDPAVLAGLTGVADEVVIQTYQGRQTIPGYEAYIAALAKLPLPYKVGLVEGGAWRAPPGLASDPDFKGYVVFLVNRPL